VNAIAFDTLDASKTLRNAGVDERTAEAIVAVVQRTVELPPTDHLATREQVERLEEHFERLEASTREHFERLEVSTRDQIERLEASTRGQIERLEAWTRARFDAVDARFDALEAKVDALDKRLTSRFDDLKTTVYAAVGFQLVGLVGVAGFLYVVLKHA